jgi:protocatechuate 3,4-dioxygenase, alpha subunit
MTTPSQTVGPFYAIGLVADSRAQSRLAADGIMLAGQLFDGQGDPISDGLIEAWDAAGARWGRSGTDGEGRFSFRVPRDAAHLEVYVFARGLLRHQWTRIYLDGSLDDEVLAGLDPARRATLMPRREGDELRFDIHMQGDDATVFFAH